ncbi:hypothetical protein NT04LM_3122 [Listeria monocytogenes FSL F2-208]|nr:hypothetical protein NT04LM_3122 [Listeria monocytogenes FSL F2-208]
MEITSFYPLFQYSISFPNKFPKNRPKITVNLTKICRLNDLL